MGHLINPISNRLSINTFWNSNWALTNTFNYINIFKKDYILFQFLNWFTKKSKFGKFNIIISHYKIYRIYKNVYINFYYYNAGLEEKKFRFQVYYLLNLLKQKNNNILEKNISIENNVIRKIIFRRNNKGSIVSHKFVFRPSENSIKISSEKIKSLYTHLIKILISYLYWHLINKSLSFFFKKLSLNADEYYFNVYSLDFLNITSDVIATYMSLKLQQKYSLNWVLRPILKDLSNKIKKRIFLGFKIVCSGRFTRKQIATYSWTKKGSLRLNNFSNLVKYSESSVRLKYGLCGIKVWLNYGSNDENLFKRNLLLIYPLYTPFKYVLNYKTNILTCYLNYWFYLYTKVSFLKSKFFSFYKIFIKIKTKILVKYLINKMFEKNSNNNKFNVLLDKDNSFHIKLSDIKTISYKNLNKQKRSIFLNQVN